MENRDMMNGRNYDYNRKIKILFDSNGDTRTADHLSSYEEIKAATESHQKDVSNIMNFISDAICSAGVWHDFTKTYRLQQFYKEFTEYKQSGKDFTKSDWYQMHIRAERHHLNNNCPEDVDLIDVIEMIADCVAAGLARSGYVRPVEIPEDVLKKAVTNTAKMIESQCEVVREAPEYKQVRNNRHLPFEPF